MEGHAERKVPDGKLVRVRAEYDANTIEEVDITGDFFVDPEDGLDELTAALEGRSIEDRDALRAALDAVDVRLVGISNEDVIEALQEALRGEEA